MRIFAQTKNFTEKNILNSPEFTIEKIVEGDQMITTAKANIKGNKPEILWEVSSSKGVAYPKLSKWFQYKTIQNDVITAFEEEIHLHSTIIWY